VCRGSRRTIRTEIVVVLVGAVAAVVLFVAESPARDALVVVAAEPARRVAVDRVTDRFRLVRVITAVVIAIASPLRRYADLKRQLATFVNLDQRQSGHVSE